ncbi:MAG: MFS transporter [Clostridia bacterium]|nr:MFS transporter [Clostridia bacterium]
MNNKWRRIIFAAVYLAYTSIYVARVNLSMAGPEMMDIGILNTVQMGILGSVFSTVYAAGRLINGGLSDKAPPWLMLTVGLALAGLSNIFVSLFTPLIGLFLLWTTNAYAQSMLWSSVLCVVSSMYEKSVAKQKTSVMVTSVAMGNILGIVINTFLITKFGARFAFVIPGVLTAVLGIIVFFATRSIKPIASPDKKHISMLSLLKNQEMLSMSVPAMMHGVMKENISLWMAVYIVDTYCVDLSTSSYYILLIPIIGFIGRTVYPAAYKLCKNRENTVSLIGFIICVAASVLLCFSGVGMIWSVLALSIIYAAVSMINTSILSIYPLHYLKTGNVASVSGIMDFGTYLGGGIASMIYGVVIKHFGYLPMFVSWAIISVVSIVFIMKINQKRKAEVKSE